MTRTLSELVSEAAREAVAALPTLDPSDIGEVTPVDCPDEPHARAFPPAFSVADLLAAPEPEETWFVEGLIPQDGNVLVAGYPKSCKTSWLLELGVSGASATPFLGRFAVPRRYRVGLVLMEDRPHRIRKRLSRICLAHGFALEELEGWLFVWFRPPLRLGHAPTMRELTEWVAEYELDALFIDNWALVSEGDSDKADQVTPQLDALAKIRETRPIVAGLVHHARKTTRDADAERLTDMVRNSSAFGAWYDAGVVLNRINETSPVGVRAELRDHPSPEPFSFVVEDEFPPGPELGRLYPDGYLRLRAMDATLQQADQASNVEKIKPKILDFLAAHPGCSKKELEDGVGGKRDHVRAAFGELLLSLEVRYTAPAGRGVPGKCYLKLEAAA